MQSFRIHVHQLFEYVEFAAVRFIVFGSQNIHLYILLCSNAA